VRRGDGDPGMLRDSIQELFEACLRVQDEFSPVDKDYDQRELIRSEARRESDLILIINRLTAMALTTLMIRANHQHSDILSHDLADASSRAKEIITPFFMRRRDRGPFELVYVINRFFENNDSVDPVGLFCYLRAAVRIRYSNYRRKSRKLIDPEYIRTGRNLNSWVRRSGRYIYEKSFIVDSSVRSDSSDSRIPHEEDILRICGSDISPAEKVPVIVDSIFDSLAEREELKSRVARDTLVPAIIKIQNPHQIEVGQNRISTMDLYIRRELIEISLSIVSELKANYSWRTNFPQSERGAILDAVEDYLLDLGVKKQKPMRDYLEPHTGGCTAGEYRRRYKGSLQNLIKKAEQRWLEKVRCIPGLLYHLKGEFYE